MARIRFNADEKAIIAEGLHVEWRNVTQWHRGTLISGIKVADGWQYVEVINMETTRTVSKGQTIRVSPGHIRRAS